MNRQGTSPRGVKGDLRWHRPAWPKRWDALAAVLLVAAMILTWLIPSGIAGASAPPPQHWTVISSTLGQSTPNPLLLIHTNGPPNASVPITIDGQSMTLRFHNSWAEILLPQPGSAIVWTVPSQITLTQDVTAVAPPTPSRQPITGLPYMAHPASKIAPPPAKVRPLRIPSWLNTAWALSSGAVGSLGGSNAAFKELNAFQIEHAPTIYWRDFLSSASAGRVPGQDTLLAKLTGRNVIEMVVPAGDVGPTAIGTYELTGGGTGEWVFEDGSKIPVTVSRYASKVGTQVADAIPVIDRHGAHITSPIDTSAEVAVEDAAASSWWGRASRFGDVLGLVAVGVSCIQGEYEILNQHNYALGVKDLGEAVGAALSFEAVDAGMAIGGALGDGPGLLVGAAAGFAVGIALPWLVGHGAEWVGSVLAHTFHWPWEPEANQANVYAPDIFFVNHTGHTVALSITESGFGTYDVKPSWTGPQSWQGTVTTTGSFVLKSSHTAVPYLHYEATGLALWQTTDGWVIPARQFKAWAVTTLARYGFPARAITHFVARWSSLAKGPGYLAIYPQTARATLGAIAPLKVSSAVPTHRVWFAVKLLNPARPLPVIPLPAISHFTPGYLSVWEWGVTFLGRPPTHVVQQGGHP